MAKLTTEELIAAFKELTLVELNDFVKAFEEEFDVTAAAPVAAVAAAPVGGASSLPVPSNARCPTMIRRRRDVAAHCWGSDGARRWPARTFRGARRTRPSKERRHSAILQLGGPGSGR